MKLASKSTKCLTTATGPIGTDDVKWMECPLRGIRMYECGDRLSFIPGSAISTCVQLPKVRISDLLTAPRLARNPAAGQDSNHTAKALQTLAAQLGVQLLWLPEGAFDLNPMDTLWGQGKAVNSANKQYTNIDQQAESFIMHLTSLSNREALKTSGVLSVNFWLGAFCRKLLQTCLVAWKGKRSKVY